MAFECALNAAAACTPHCADSCPSQSRRLASTVRDTLRARSILPTCTFGWSSLTLALRREGIYEELCDAGETGCTEQTLRLSMVYTAGAVGALANGTDAFAALSSALAASGSAMNAAVNCLFFLAELSDMGRYFSGFFVAFNTDAPPPPSRTEFVAAPAERAGKITAKCIAVLP